ncbi:hypothetical protein [Eupransor demetentiae]
MEELQKIDAKNRKRRKKRLIIIGLAVVIVPVLISLSHIKTVTGGSAEFGVRHKMINQLSSELEDEDFTGKIKNFRARHAGFSQGGIDASFDYVEKHDNVEIKIPVDFRCSDDGDLGSDVKSILIPLKAASLQQPAVEKEKDRVKKFFTNISNEGRYSLEKVDPTFCTDGVYGDQQDRESQLTNLNQIARKNRSGSKKQQYAAGYYDIPLKELKANNFYYYTLSVEIGDPRKKNFETKNFQQFLIDKINQSHLPDGRYYFDIGANDNRSGSYLFDSTTVVVKDGVAGPLE